MAEPATNSVEPKLTKLKDFKLPAAVLALEAASDGRTLFVACLDGAVFKLDAESGERTELGRHESYASGVALVSGGTTMVSGGYDGTLLWHDLASGNVIRRIKVHDFWSWDLAASPDGQLVASVTGQYLAGGYKYEPAPEREPSVKVFDATTGELRH
jgi:WD40 repeat protein